MSEELFSRDEADEIRKADTLPAGTYPVTIVGAEVKTKDDKKFLNLRLQINDGHEMAGRNKFFNIYLRNGHPNPKVCAIHSRIRQSLDKALGLEMLTVDSILGQMLSVKITNSQSKDGATMYENIERFLPL